jgi:hypothetical protein
VAVDRGRVKVVAPQGQGVLLNLRSREAQELASVLAEATSPLLMRATMRATQRDRIIDYLCGGTDTSVLAVGCPDCQARPGQPCPTRGLLCNGRVAAIIGLAPPDPDADNEPDELLAAPAVSPRSALAVLPTLVIEAAKVLAARILGGAR